MLQKYKSKREEGFTIIEVLIVLAIAGLIILIVFLAVPALQRRARNNQRIDDANRFIVAFKECLTNNKAKGSVCFGGTITDYYDVADNLQLTEPLAFAPDSNELDRLLINAGMQCNPQANGVEPSELPTKVFAITYLVETGSSTATRCIDAGF